MTTATTRDIVSVALSKNCKIRFRYKKANGEETTRTIHPLVMFRYRDAEGQTFKYVVGFCELRLDYRTFRLDRMSEALLVNEAFPSEIGDINTFLTTRLGQRGDDSSGFYMPRVQVLQVVGKEPVERASAVGERVYGIPENVSIIDYSDYRGDTQYPKYWESPKLINSPARCRSPLEEEVFRELDSESDVLYYKIEPFKIPYFAGCEVKYYIPDLLVAYKDGKQVIVEIKTLSDSLSSKNKAKLRAIEEYAEENGYDFEIWPKRSYHDTPIWKETAAAAEKRPEISVPESQTVSFWNEWGLLIIVAFVSLLLWILSK